MISDPWEVVLHDFPLVHGWFLKIFACQETGLTEQINVCEGKKKAFQNMCSHAKQTSIDVSYHFICKSQSCYLSQLFKKKELRTILKSLSLITNELSSMRLC